MLHGFTDTIQKQNSYGNLLEILSSTSLASGIGFRIKLASKVKKLVFEVYKGVDRTVNQSLTAPLIFSREFENVLEQTYIESLNNFANTALIAGEGEGIDRVIETIASGTGLDRYELFEDAKDIQKTTEISENDYTALLLQRGQEKLAECFEIKTFDSVVNTVNTKGFGVGDMVTIIEKNWGVMINTRITEIVEIYENKGKTVNLVLGNNVPTLYEKIKRKGGLI